MDIAFPFHFERGATATAPYDSHVRDMIELLLFTNPGERVNRPEFGSGLLQMVFAPNSPELAATLQFTVQAALGQWLGDVIDVRELSVSSDDAALRVTLNYLVRASGEVRTEDFTRELSA
jgi:phage baseplate assembly protein W